MTLPVFEITREYTFSAAHVLEGHPKCGRLHGHNYTVTIGLTAEHVDASGWVMDFAEVDEIVKPLIDAMDHRFLVSDENSKARLPYADIAQERGDAFELPAARSTAELIAKFIFECVDFAALPPGVSVFWVTVRETPKSEATYYGV